MARNRRKDSGAASVAPNAAAGAFRSGASLGSSRQRSSGGVANPRSSELDRPPLGALASAAIAANARLRLRDFRADGLDLDRPSVPLAGQVLTARDALRLAQASAAEHRARVQDAIDRAKPANAHLLGPTERAYAERMRKDLCKDRPSPDKGSGARGKIYIPWCDKRS